MEQHILPHNDIGIHTENTTCNCNPAVIFENNNMIVIHNAFDKREQNECKHYNAAFDLNVVHCPDCGKILKILG